MKLLRAVLFWLHLAAGLIAGLAIGIMCLTGAALAFEKQLVAWAERDARQIAIPAADDAPRVPLADLVQCARTVAPESKPTTLIASADPTVALAITRGRGDVVYANPFTGEVRAPASTRVRDTLKFLEQLHRVLALSGDRRPIGKAINGACNLAFCFLAVSGLYLWWPRNLTWRSVRAVALFNGRLTGKARDFNWHNAVGLWCAPVLIVLTLTALPISYRWASNGVFRLFGDTPPAANTEGPTRAETGTPREGRAPAERSAHALDLDRLLASARTEIPHAESYTLRLNTPPRAATATVVVREPSAWPRTANTTLTLDAQTGAVVRRESFADLTAGRRARTWTRFLHTGEALGLAGQLVAGLACLGGVILVYTGFALAWRRFFPGKRATTATAAI
ncbi:MAG: PepSY domain-containing protein [Candidatus Didemnitutus sp.]|nr:PepSY domain-containing protein [Candidatus Didemnitutus sp.]